MLSLYPVRKLHLTAYSVLIGMLLAGTVSFAANEEASSDKSAVTPAAVQSTDSTSSAPRAEGSTKPAPTVRLHAEVVDCVNPELSKSISDLYTGALEKIKRAELLEKEKHYKKGIAKLVAAGKDVAELATAYKGFEQSSEAADIILDEKHKMKSGAAVAYIKQKQADTTHEKIITALMQIATGIGITDQEQSKTAINEGVAELEDLTDKDMAQKTAEALKNWCQSQKVLFHPPLTGPMQIQAECHDVVGRAVKADPVVKEITASLHKYNGRSKFARGAAKVINTTLSIAELSPSFISPAAQVAWAAYIMTQGGPEESKLLKEVYLAKRFENRYQTLNNETSLAVNSYNSALMSQNPALLSFSQFMVGQLCQPPQPAVQPETGKKSGIAGLHPLIKRNKVAAKHSSSKSDKKISDKDLSGKPDEKVADKDSSGKPDEKKVADKDSAAGEVASKDSSAGKTQ